MLTPAGNRFGLPAFYSLHAWIWKHNPRGTFNPWNPTVRCDKPYVARTGEAIDGMASMPMSDSVAVDAADGD